MDGAIIASSTMVAVSITAVAAKQPIALLPATGIKAMAMKAVGKRVPAALRERRVVLTQLNRAPARAGPVLLAP